MSFDIQEELLTCMPDMRAFARFLTKDRAWAEDLVQDASVRVLTAAEQFEPGTNFKAWVFTILRNLYYNELQKNRRLVSQGDGDEGLRPEFGQGPTQEVPLDFRDFHQAFWELEEIHREVLMLVGSSGFSYEATAEVCGCTVGTVKSRVSRARRALKDKMVARGHGADAAERDSQQLAS